MSDATLTNVNDHHYIPISSQSDSTQDCELKFQCCEMRHTYKLLQFNLCKTWVRQKQKEMTKLF